MDVLQLIDKLEQLVVSGGRLPLSTRIIVDEQQFLDVIDQLRVTVPEEIKQARRVSSESERVLEQAESEAEKIINTAREQATLMLQDTEIVRAAEEKAALILQSAHEQADEVRLGADQYAMDVLSGLENELTKLLITARKGRATLDRKVSRSGPLGSEPPNGAE